MFEFACRFFLISTTYAVTTTIVISAVTIKYIQSYFDTAPSLAGFMSKKVILKND